MIQDRSSIAPTSEAKASAQSAGQPVMRRFSRRGKGIGTVEPGRLRLTGTAAPDMKPPTSNPTPIQSPSDPRWVLAIRTAQVLEGELLTTDRRHSLMMIGKSMGLSAFDCSLILAIVQDRARRGIPPNRCPAESVTQLAMIPPPAVRTFSSIRGSLLRTALLALGLLALQFLLIWHWLG